MRVEIGLVVGWEADGTPTYRAIADANLTNIGNVQEAELLAVEEDIKIAASYIVTAEVNLPEKPPVERVAGEVKEVL